MKLHRTRRPIAGIGYSLRPYLIFYLVSCDLFSLLPPCFTSSPVSVLIRTMALNTIAIYHLFSHSRVRQIGCTFSRTTLKTALARIPSQIRLLLLGSCREEEGYACGIYSVQIGTTVGHSNFEPLIFGRQFRQQRMERGNLLGWWESM